MEQCRLLGRRRTLLSSDVAGAAALLADAEVEVEGGAASEASARSSITPMTCGTAWMGAIRVQSE